MDALRDRGAGSIYLEASLLPPLPGWRHDRGAHDDRIIHFFSLLHADRRQAADSSFSGASIENLRFLSGHLNEQWTP